MNNTNYNEEAFEKDPLVAMVTSKGYNTPEELACEIFKSTLNLNNWISFVNVNNESINIEDNKEDVSSIAKKIVDSLTKDNLTIIDVEDNHYENLSWESFIECFYRLMENSDWKWIIKDMASSSEYFSKFACNSFVQTWLYGYPVYF